MPKSFLKKGTSALLALVQNCLIFKQIVGYWLILLVKNSFQVFYVDLISFPGFPRFPHATLRFVALGRLNETIMTLDSVPILVVHLRLIGYELDIVAGRKK